ncbi:MAG: hypothetical protein ACI9JY_002712, partial [Saprospiraceae bacterium]
KREDDRDEGVGGGDGVEQFGWIIGHLLPRFLLIYFCDKLSQIEIMADFRQIFTHVCFNFGVKILKMFGIRRRKQPH